VRRVLSYVSTWFCDDELSYVVHVDVRGAVAFDCECASAEVVFPARTTVYREIQRRGAATKPAEGP